MHTKYLKRLEKEGISFPTLKVTPSNTFDQYVDERLYIYSQYLFSSSPYVLKIMSNKFLKSAAVNLSLITIIDPLYVEAINTQWNGPKNADYYTLFVSETPHILEGYNKVMRKSVAFPFTPVNNIDPSYESKDNYIIFIYEAWVGRATTGEHKMMVYVDVKKRVLNLFDPQLAGDNLDRIGGYLLTRYFKNYTLNNLVINIDFQSMNSKLFFTCDMYCVTWSFMMATLFDMNGSPKKIVKMIHEFGEDSRYLMIYFGYILYETLLHDYQLTVHQSNVLSLHKKLVKDMEVLKGASKDPLIKKVLSFVKLYDFMLYYTQSQGSIPHFNKFMDYNIKEFIKDKGDPKKEKALVKAFLNDMDRCLPHVIYKKVLMDSMDCVLF